jgi:hypothetical protein
MAKKNDTMIGALNRIADELELKKSAKNGSTRLSGIEYPNLTIGPYEEVLIFDVVGHVVLHEEPASRSKPRQTSAPGYDAFWHITGKLIDVAGSLVEGGEFETVFPFRFDLAPQILTWPPQQGGPFNAPPVDGKLTDGYGFSKTNFIFPNGSIVTVGPSIPKFVNFKNGGAQLWVTSVGVTTDGTGQFAGVRGMGAFNGSAYFAQAPDFSTEAGRKPLRDGFPVKVSINLKLSQSGNLG